MLGFNLKREIGLGEILTSVTILTSVFTLAYSWKQELDKSQSVQVNQIRIAAAETLVKLDRWREISSSYEDLHPLFVEASEILSEKKDVTKARDFLYKGLINSKANNDGKILDEKIELASVELYSYNQEFHKLFVCTIKQIRNTKENAFDMLLADTEQVILNSDAQDWGNTASVGNALRETLTKYTQSLQTGIDPVLDQARLSLQGVISKQDTELAKRESGFINTNLCK